MTLSQVNELLYPRIRAGDVAGVEELLVKYPELIATQRELDRHLNTAACYNRLGVMELVSEWGADIEFSPPGFEPATPLHMAADEGAADAMRWLLARGAVVDLPKQEGRHRCPGLSSAALIGSLECVRILIEAGAPLDACGEHALRCAKYGGHTAVADYLCSVGVPDDEPEGDEASDEFDGSDLSGGPIPELRQHLEQRLLGTIEPDAVFNILPTDPPITLLVLNQFDIRKVLVTEGLSAVRLAGDERFARAELAVRLPADWPLTLDDPARAWPVLWLRRLAHLAVERAAGFRLFTVYDHEEPLADGVRFTGWLVIASPGETGTFTRADGETVQLYDLIPLLPDELAAFDRDGVRPLLERLDGRDDVREVTPDRPSLFA